MTRFLKFILICFLSYSTVTSVSGDAGTIAGAVAMQQEQEMQRLYALVNNFFLISRYDNIPKGKCIEIVTNKTDIRDMEFSDENGKEGTITMGKMSFKESLKGKLSFAYEDSNGITGELEKTKGSNWVFEYSDGRQGSIEIPRSIHVRFNTEDSNSKGHITKEGFSGKKWLYVDDFGRKASMDFSSEGFWKVTVICTNKEKRN